MWKKEEISGIVREIHFNRDVKVYKERPKTIPDMFLQTVKRYPKREALVKGDIRLSYEEIWSRSETIAANLYQRFHIKKGTRVALLMGNSIEFSLLFLACAKLGAIVVPLNTRLAKKEITYMMEQSGSALMFLEEEFRTKAEGISVPKLLIDISDPKFLSFDQLMINGASYPKPVINEDDPLYVMYTSGTTGVPKGAIGTHIGVIHSVISYQRIFKTNDHDRSLNAVPLFHVTGLVGQLLHMVYVGGTNILMHRYKAELFNKLLAEENITFTFNVPTIYVMMMAHASFKKYNYDHVRILAYGGAPMSTQTIYQLKKEFPNAELHNAYGATETSSPTTVMPKGYQEKKLTSIGMPIPVIEVKIMGEDGPCNVKEVGELYIKGPNIVPSYWKNDQATKNSFVDGYWCSGDLAMMDEDGFIYIMDRMKEMINRGGEKIFSIEVENILYNHPGILEAAVVGVPDEVFGERIKAVIVPKENISLTEEEVKMFVRNHLADYKTPEIIEFTEQLPRNPGGKIVKSLLSK
ncbi:acyl--CoA ligase [bacterium LRH843]|nr:acyl--CoA ligase [bacterium LRH843]